MTAQRSDKRLITLAALLVTALAVVLVAPFVGTTTVSLSAVLRPSDHETTSHIFWDIRVPRIMMSLLAGAALAVSGMAFQAMFRNPLATPFTLGVASGASLGAAVYMRLGLAVGLLGVSGMSAAAFAGALGAILMVYGLARARRGFSGATMLLAGVAGSFFFSSILRFMHYIGDPQNSCRLLRWIMGGLQTFGYGQVVRMLPFVVSGSAIVVYLTRELNLITTGDDIAVSRGVDVRRTKHVLFFATSLMVGGVVAVCGPIGFVGMMSPHICRLLIGADHRYLTPATLVFGALFLTVCDLPARTLIGTAEIPVGVITALLGGPFFLWLLLRRGALLHGV